jgi:hypothetical protein
MTMIRGFWFEAGLIADHINKKPAIPDDGWFSIMSCDRYRIAIDHVVKHSVIIKQTECCHKANNVQIGSGLGQFIPRDIYYQCVLR